ncbi:hypothetical protein RJ639_038499 [Escallonia herrerae]|uniref:CCHC-type domain-containing protein n=1 Tax=Escallonia herrerae TaxID=1293975 RepID=A0AA88WZK3_9ASTE|nr:hypothetical protein RJ639_038499 [Escallonia herrerae]
MAEEGKGKIEKFNGMNFQWWKMQVKDYLYQKDLYLPLVGEKPEAMNAMLQINWNLSALIVMIKLGLRYFCVHCLILEKLYEKPSASNKVFLMKKLFNMRMSENGSVVDHLNDFNSVTNQLESVGINCDDKIRASLFLCSLSDSWNNLVTTMNNSTISGTLTFNGVVSSVMIDEIWRKTIGNGISSSTALSMESRGRQNNKQNNRGISPIRGRSRSRSKSKSKGKTIVCWNCNKEGHKKNDCTELKKKNGAGGRQGDDEGVNMKNLISVSGLDYEGYFVAFGEKQWKVIKGSMVVARGERVGTLYTLSGNKIKCLKSDNGGEYRDGGFQEYYSNNDIRLIRTVKWTPQENGLTVRMNRTIMERARCIRIHADLPLQF